MTFTGVSLTSDPCQFTASNKSEIGCRGEREEDRGEAPVCHMTENCKTIDKSDYFNNIRMI